MTITAVLALTIISVVALGMFVALFGLGRWW